MPFTVTELHQALRTLDTVRYGSADLSSALDRIVRATHDLFSVDGAALMLIDDQLILRNAVVSDERLSPLEDLQLRHGSGPCVEAFERKTLVSCDDLAADDRWKEFAAEATDLGLRAMLASPIPFATDAVGVVAVFSAERHPWTPEGELALTAFTDLAALAITMSLRSDERGERANQLQQALDARACIEQAKGILVGTEGLSAREAFERLRSDARRQRRKLADVASEVVARAQGG
ncbi:MAG: GAF and ANTAR domain-containing protein [Actinomycetota bacterium]|nr:GAF and ANTAR domain-containing protein [Actinomycetota bacterium]